jgi:nitroreductase
MTDPADAIRPLLRVRQVREFTGEPVDPSALDAIADAARWSGSSKNTQPWRFITIREPATLRALAEAGPPQTRGLATAPAAIAIAMPEAEGKAVSFAYDEARAAERILIAASLLELGAGISWILGPVRPTVAALLHLPNDRFVRTIVAIGHPSDAARRPKSPRGAARLGREETVLSERWPG